ncbi:lantibiotic dehydratase [Actinokineospora sp. 24-640]
MSFSPYVLFRRGTLAPAALDGLVPERTWALMAEADAARAERAALRERLADALHAAIPALPADSRRAWLKVKRDVHNDRVPTPPDPTALPAQCADLLAEWTEQRARGEHLAEEAAAAYAAELDAARKALAEVAVAEDFQRGVQLSGEDVYREVRAYAADPFDTSRKPSRRRRAESTITSFAYRVVFKPSPFGSFTEIGAHGWTPERAGGRVAQTRLSVGLIAWMAHQLHRLDCAADVLHVRLNNSLIVRGEQATFARRPLEGADDGFTPDRVITARNSGLVTLLRTLLGEHDRTERDLCGRLVEAGLAEQAARNTIDQLVKLGLCHRGLGFPDQETRQADAIARRLRAAGTAQALRCAEVFEGLRDIEDGYADADAERRTGLLADLRALVARYVDILGCPPPAKEAMRAAMYEDVGTRAPAATWRPDLFEANGAALALFQRVVPVLDDATIEKLGLYAFATSRFGDQDVPFLDLYRAFADLAPQDASSVMCGVGDPESDRVRELRAQFFTMLREHLDGGPEVRLDVERLRAFADTLPATVVPWRSAAYRVQVGDRLVVNGVTTGHGVFFSRYCDLLETGHGWNLRTELATHIAATSPRQTDITAALGLNFNLHPRLSPHELVYPGSVARDGAENTLTLADLVVRADPATRRLVLVSIQDDQPVDLVPLNFLYPAAAPMLYRFLCAFAPTRTYRGGLWDQLDRVEPATTGRPRVLLGDLVLDRRSWRFAAADLPALDGLERQELSALAAFDRWRREHGLPRHTFFRVWHPRPVTGERDLLAETRQWALEARSARLHKPHHLDSHNPFLLHVLAKQAKDGGSVVFHECLPGPGEHSAEEFFVEYNLEGDAHAG